MNLDDEKLYELINIAHARIDFLEGIFKKNKFKYLILTHTVFVDYGTIALVAKKFNCKIKIIFPDNNYSKIIILNIDNRYLLQIEKYYNYKNEFKKFKNKIDCLKKSQIELNNRIYKNITNPKVSNVAIYSKDNIVSFKSKKPKIIVLPSCFFDAQSFFRYSLFSDVHEWLDYTLYYASKTNFEWYVKPHPTNLKINNSIYRNFKKKYEKINFLNVNTSNLSFKKNNFSSMFTYQSSAVHEFAMMNIPSVVVGDNISVNYRFGFPVKSIKSYKNLIYNANQINNRIKKKEVLEFNYMWRFENSSSWKHYILDNKYKNQNSDLFSFKNSLFLEKKFLNDKIFKKNLNKMIELNFK